MGKRVVRLNEKFANLAQGFEFKKEFMTGECMLVLDDNKFDEWLHINGLKTDFQTIHWKTQRFIMSGFEIVGRYWETQQEYESNNFLFGFA